MGALPAPVRADSPPHSCARGGGRALDWGARGCARRGAASNVSRHVAALKQAGLVALRRDGTRALVRLRDEGGPRRSRPHLRPGAGSARPDRKPQAPRGRSSARATPSPATTSTGRGPRSGSPRARSGLTSPRSRLSSLTGAWPSTRGPATGACSRCSRRCASGSSPSVDRSEAQPRHGTRAHQAP